MSFPTCPSSRNTLTLSSVPATTLKSTGSDTTSAPFGTLNVDAPENVSGTTVFESTAGEPPTSPSGRASVTAVMGIVVVPNAFRGRGRMRDAFAVTWIVESAKTSPVVSNGGSGRSAGSVSCGIAVHTATQCPVGWLARSLMCEFPATSGERKDAAETAARKRWGTVVLLHVGRVESLRRSAESATVKDWSTTSDACL